MPQPISNKIVRICQECGESFHPTARKQFCCNKEKIKECVICHNKITYKCNTSYSKETCSRECASKLSKLRKDVNSKDIIKKCKWCGEPFTPNTSRDVYCHNIHYKICEICGNQFEIDVRQNKDTRTCSKECKNKLQALNRDYQKEHSSLVSTLLDKYGVDNAMKIPNSLHKMKKTNLEKYGKEWYTQTNEYKDKVANTSLTKYGVRHFLKSNIVKSKRASTCLRRYGAKNAAKSLSVKNKILKTVKYKYGVINVSQNHIVDKESWTKFTQNPRDYIISAFDEKPTINELASNLGVCITSIYNYLDLEHNYDIIQKAYSNMEDEVVAFIYSISKDICIQRNNRTIISPYELDVYLPEYNLAIECNPTSTHNSSSNDPWGNPPKMQNYHQMKTQLCDDKGIRLLHIFGHEWITKQDIIKSMIRNIIRRNDNSIYARKCSIKLISYLECKHFLNENHRQGNSNSVIRLGLYLSEELVSVMTFSKTRNTIKSINEPSCWELVRFCNKLNTSVVGGASKLFNYFVNTFRPDRIISFSDRAHTTGNLYKVLSFKEIRRSDPGYMWVNLKTDIAYNRLNSQKHNLKRFLKDDDIDLSKTEKQIMEEHGFVQVYDSGTITWEWTNS